MTVKQSYCNEMKDRQHQLSLVTVQPDVGSHSWQPSESICSKLSGCSLNQSVPHLKPMPISAVSQRWAVGRRCLRMVLSWLSRPCHRQTTPAQQSDLCLIQSATVYSTQAYRWMLTKVQVYLGLEIVFFPFSPSHQKLHNTVALCNLQSVIF